MNYGNRTTKRGPAAAVQPPAPTQVAPRGPRPVFSGTVKITPAGYWTGDFPPLVSISLANTGNFWMIAHLAQPAAAAPVDGPGVHHLEPGGRERRLPADGTVLTIYGTPGELIGLVAYTGKNLEL